MYSLCLVTTIDHEEICASSPDLMTLAMHVYCPLSPSSRSVSNTLNLESLVLMESIEQEE